VLGLARHTTTVKSDHYGHLFPDELQQLADRLQDASPKRLRTQRGPRPPAGCSDKAKEQVSDLLRLVEVGRLELRPAS
jgi:hypothetical protein